MLQFRNVSKSYGEQTVLDNISFTVKKGDKVGLIGENGAGKSTLLSAIVGNIDFHGSIDAGNSTIAYLPQSPDFNLKNTVQEELLSAFSEVLRLEDVMRSLEKKMGDPAIYEDSVKLEEVAAEYQAVQDEFSNKRGFEIESRVATVYNKLELDFSKDQLVSTLSGGQKSLLALAKVLVEDFDIFLLDEPTNHLDIVKMTWLEKYLRDTDKTLLVVSHDRYFLDNVVNRIVEIEAGKTRNYLGNYSTFMGKKAQLKKEQLRAFERNDLTLTRRRAAMEQFNSGNPKLAKQYKSRKKLLSKIELVEKPVDKIKRIDLNFSTDSVSDRQVLEVKAVAKKFGSNVLFSDLSFNVERKNRFAILGPNGVGKSTLLRVIAGQLSGDEGTVELGLNVKAAFFDQEHADLDESSNVIDAASSINSLAKPAEVRKTLAKLGFKGKEAYKKVSDLSLGERARLVFSRLILSKANLLFLDEPTNHLDLHSREVLERVLQEYTGTLVFVSHDRYFIQRLCDHLIVFNKKGVQVYRGDYDYYRSKVQGSN